MKYTKEEQKAISLYNKGRNHSVSTFIDEDTIIAGYGKLDYDFEFPLPVDYIEKLYGTTSWSQWFKNKGLYKYISTNLKTGEKSITPYMTEEEAKETLKNNKGFKLEKI